MPDPESAATRSASVFTVDRLRRLVPHLILLTMSGFFLLLTTGHSTRLTQSFHGLYHAAYATQLANGIIPPTNPSSIGMPANYYWIWHGLLAMLSRVFEISVFQAHLVVSWISISIFLSVLWIFAKRRAWSPLSRLAACFLPFILLDPIGLAGYFQRALSAAGVPTVLTPSVVHLMPARTLMGVDLHPIAGHLLNTLCNFSSFPAALALYALVILIFAQSGHVRKRSLAIFVLTCLCALFSPLPAAGIVGVAVAFTFVRWAEGLRGAALWFPALATAAGILMAVPYLLSLAQAFGSEIRIYLEPTALARHALSVGWPLAAAVPSYVLGAIWIRNLHTEERVWLVLGTGCGVVAMMTAAPVGTPNEYKLILLTALPSALLTLAVARELGRRLPIGASAKQGLRAFTTLVLVVGAVTAVGATTILYRNSAWAQQNPYRYEGRHIELESRAGPNRKSLADAYHWLRNNTPVHAIVLERPVHGNDVLTPAISERRVVTVSVWHHNEAIPHQRALSIHAAVVAKGLAKCKVSALQLEQLFQVPADWPDRIYAIAPVMSSNLVSRCGDNLDVRIEIAHQNDFYRVFSIRR